MGSSNQSQSIYIFLKWVCFSVVIVYLWKGFVIQGDLFVKVVLEVNVFHVMFQIMVLLPQRICVVPLLADPSPAETFGFDLFNTKMISKTLSRIGYTSALRTL